MILREVVMLESKSTIQYQWIFIDLTCKAVFRSNKYVLISGTNKQRWRRYSKCLESRKYSPIVISWLLIKLKIMMNEIE